MKKPKELQSQTRASSRPLKQEPAHATLVVIRSFSLSTRGVLQPIISMLLRGGKRKVGTTPRQTDRQTKQRRIRNRIFSESSAESVCLISFRKRSTLAIERGELLGKRKSPICFNYRNFFAQALSAKSYFIHQRGDSRLRFHEVVAEYAFKFVALAF